jgi:hypothetical protein
MVRLACDALRLGQRLLAQPARPLSEDAAARGGHERVAQTHLLTVRHPAQPARFGHAVVEQALPMLAPHLHSEQECGEGEGAKDACDEDRREKDANCTVQRERNSAIVEAVARPPLQAVAHVGCGARTDVEVVLLFHGHACDDVGQLGERCVAVEDGREEHHRERERAAEREEVAADTSTRSRLRQRRDHVHE